MSKFLFATGIECSYPTIEHGRWRIDQLEATRHYEYWRKDLELVREIGLEYLRYGPPLYRIHLGRGKYDWSFPDQVCAAMQELKITPIMDLCHFGVPDWLENFQNPEFPEAFAEYAAAFAKRYPWVRFYTPVNEMSVTARMSALDGTWNEQCRDDNSYVRAIRHIAKANLLAVQAIQRERPDAIFVNSESSELYQACCPQKEIRRIADFENQRRFLAMDLAYAHPVRADMYAYLLDHGMPREEYEWFMNQDAARRAVLGIDYYEWNEKLIDANGRPENLGELFGWYVIAHQYYDRYLRPLMHTETNTPNAEDAPGWLWRQWHNVQLIRQAGCPVIGFTWYSLQDQVDWQIGLSKANGNIFPVGLFDLNRDPRPVAQAYRHLLKMFRDEPFLSGEDVLVLS